MTLQTEVFQMCTSNWGFVCIMVLLFLFSIKQSQLTKPSLQHAVAAWLAIMVPGWLMMCLGDGWSSDGVWIRNSDPWRNIQENYKKKVLEIFVLPRWCSSNTVQNNIWAELEKGGLFSHSSFSVLALNLSSKSARTSTDLWKLELSSPLFSKVWDVYS